MCAADIPRPLLEMKLNFLNRRDNAAELLGEPSQRVGNTSAYTKGTGFHGERGKAQGNIKWGMTAAGEAKLKTQWEAQYKDAPRDTRPSFDDYMDNWLVQQRRNLDTASASIKRYEVRLQNCERDLAAFEADNQALAALSRHDIELMLEGGNVDNAELPITQHSTAAATQTLNDENVESILDSLS